MSRGHAPGFGTDERDSEWEEFFVARRGLGVRHAERGRLQRQREGIGRGGRDDPRVPLCSVTGVLLPNSRPARAPLAPRRTDPNRMSLACGRSRGDGSWHWWALALAGLAYGHPRPSEGIQGVQSPGNQTRSVRPAGEARGRSRPVPRPQDDRGATKPAGRVRDSPPVGGSFPRKRRWLARALRTAEGPLRFASTGNPCTGSLPGFGRAPSFAYGRLTAVSTATRRCARPVHPCREQAPRLKPGSAPGCRSREAWAAPA